MGPSVARTTLNQRPPSRPPPSPTTGRKGVHPMTSPDATAVLAADAEVLTEATPAKAPAKRAPAKSTGTKTAAKKTAATKSAGVKKAAAKGGAKAAADPDE